MHDRTNILFHFWRSGPCGSRIFFPEPFSRFLLKEKDLNDLLMLLIRSELLSNPLWNVPATELSASLIFPDLTRLFT